MKLMMNAFVAAAAAAALAGCGGDGDNEPRVELAIAVTEATPASENGVIEPAKAASVSNQARAADASFPEAYCAITFSTAPSSNGKSYQVQVYFRQSDANAVFASLADLGAAYSVGLLNTTVTGITGVTVDRLKRTIEYNGANLTGVVDATQAAKLTGTIAFPANPANNACG